MIDQEVDLELEQSVLCDLAKRDLRERWLKERELIISIVRDSLDKPARQRDEAGQELKLVAFHLGLDPNQQQDLAREYLPLRARMVDDARAILSARPVPYERLPGLLRSFYAEEDRMIQRLFDQDALRKLRLSFLEQRTSVMALAVVLGGGELDDSISW